MDIDELIIFLDDMFYSRKLANKGLPRIQGSLRVSRTQHRIAYGGNRGPVACALRVVLYIGLDIRLYCWETLGELLSTTKKVGGFV